MRINAATAFEVEAERRRELLAPPRRMSTSEDQVTRDPIGERSSAVPVRGLAGLAAMLVARVGRRA
jgi:hypothetical protein